VSPEDQAKAEGYFGRYTKAKLAKCIDEAIYDLDVHPDQRAVETRPWDVMKGRQNHIQSHGSKTVKEEGSGPNPEENTVGAPTPLDEEQDHPGNEVSRARELPSNRGTKVEDYFRDPERIKSEMERSLSQRASSRLITAADLWGEKRVREPAPMETDIPVEMAIQEGQNLSEEHRAKLLDERMQTSTEAKTRAGKEAEARKEKLRRAKRDKDMWVDGQVGGQPTEMAYLVAQVLAHLPAFFHPDPDNPPTVKGFVAEIETIDSVPVKSRARKFAEIQKAYLRAMTKRLIRQGKLEESTGEYSSGLVLVPYHDRIKKFMDKWGDEAPKEMWKPEHEEEVGTFYRCTCDYRSLNLRSKSDVFPLPRIDDLLDQVPRGTKHFSSGDVQDAFWTVKLAEWCREKTAIRTHDQHLQWTVLPQGWKGAANYWARVVAKVFENISQDQALVYQDDVMAHSEDFASHHHTLGMVYECLIARDLTFKLKKTHLNMPCVNFLGHII